MVNSLRNWFTKAKLEQFAIGAFNVANLEIVKAVIGAAQEIQSPVIIEASPAEIEYFGFENFLAVVENFRDQTNLPIFTNLDHGTEIENVEKAIELGFDMVHFDGSDLPVEENLMASKQLVELAHRKGSLIELEFNKIQRSSQAYLEETSQEVQVEGQLTDPDQAVEITNQVKPDLLAVSLGNLHGVYQTPEELDLVRLGELNRRLSCLMSLHGGSGINQEQLKKAISLGIVKININTDLRLAFRKTLENVLKGSEEIKIYKIMPPVIGAVQKVIEEKMILFGSEGKMMEFTKIKE